MEMKKISELVTEKILHAKSETASISALPVKKTIAKYGIKKESYAVTTTMQERDYGLNKGDYVVLTYDNIGICKSIDDYFIEYLAKNIKTYVKDYHNILVIGLGNRHISADSIGPKVLHHIMPTRYIAKQKIFSCKNKLSALSTSVYALTGIDSFDIVNSVAKEIGADCVIAVDSLCANDYKRLGNSFQLHNAGIAPGGGLGNKRKVISKHSLGIPVIAIGVPLVMYASTFNDALEKELVITLKDIDDISNKIGRIIGLAISRAVTNMSIYEIEEWIRG